MVISRWLSALALGSLMLSTAAAFADAAPMPYTLDIGAPTAQKGKPTTVKIKVLPARSYHMNKEFPTSLVLTPPAGITVAKQKLAGADVKVEEAAIEFNVEFTPSQPGTKEIPGDLKFAICNADSCIPQKIKIGIQTTTK